MTNITGSEAHSAGVSYNDAFTTRVKPNGVWPDSLTVLEALASRRLVKTINLSGQTPFRVDRKGRKAKNELLTFTKE